MLNTIFIYLLRTFTNIVKIDQRLGIGVLKARESSLSLDMPRLDEFLEAYRKPGPGNSKAAISLPLSGFKREILNRIHSNWSSTFLRNLWLSRNQWLSWNGMYSSTITQQCGKHTVLFYLPTQHLFTTDLLHSRDYAWSWQHSATVREMKEIYE